MTVLGDDGPDPHGAFSPVEDAVRDQMRAIGARREVRAGEVLYTPGQDGYDCFLCETTGVDVVRGYGHENLVVARIGPGRFTGELGLITGARPQLTGVAHSDGVLVQIEAERLRRAVAQDETLSNLVLRVYLARRAILIAVGGGLTLIGSRFSRESLRLREFLARNRIPQQWMDLEEDPQAEALLQTLGVAPDEIPVVLSGDEVLRNPSHAEMAAVLGLSSRGPAPPMCDLIVVGGGPAGLAAAVYGASEGLDTQAIDSVAFGGQASTSSRIENYLGFPAGISGSELAERAVLQARKFGSRLIVPGEAAGLECEHDHFVVRLADGDCVRGRTIVVATGARYRRLPLDGLEHYEGRGVYYAATQAEAGLCAGDPVVIVGGGNSAGQAAMFLSGHAASCHLAIRREDLAATMSRYLIDELAGRPQVELLAQTEVIELRGDRALESLVLRDNRTGTTTEIEARALFVFIGAEPHTEWLADHVAGDEHGFLLTGRDLAPDQLGLYAPGDAPLFLETSRPGIFAVGDVHSGSVKRVASAVGEGSMSVRLVHQRLAAA